MRPRRVIRSALPLCLFVIVLTLVYAGGVFAQTTVFTDDFELWSPGPVHNQCVNPGMPTVMCWRGWDDDILFDAIIDSTQVLNGLQSLGIAPTSDIVHEHDFGPGIYEYRARLFIPPGSTGRHWFILLNTYSPGGTKNWSVQVVFDSDTMTVDSLGGTDTTTPGQLPLVQGVWYAIRVEVNLNVNTHNIFLDSGGGEVPLNTVPDEDYQATGQNRIEAVDLFSESQGGFVFYDDLEVDFTDCLHNTATGLNCSENLGVVTGTFMNNDAYDSIQVLRNGNPIQTLPGTATEFMDSPPAGNNTYGLVTDLGGEMCASPDMCIVAVPFPPAGPPCAPGNFITQSNSQDIVPGNSVACNAGGITSDNSYWRTFNLASFPSLPPSFDITNVEIGIELSDPGPAFMTQPAVLRIYEDFDADPAPIAGLVLLHEQSFEIGEVGPGLQCIQLDTPLTISGSSDIVVEIHVDDATFGQGHQFFIGSNLEGASSPTFISSVGCAFPEPTDLVLIGFPDMHMLMNVYHVPVGGGGPQEGFLRGDADHNGVINPLVETLFLLAFGFQGGPPPPCLDEADADGDVNLNPLVDSLYLLGFGFQGGPPPPFPWPDCDVAPFDLGCDDPGCDFGPILMGFQRGDANKSGSVDFADVAAINTYIQFGTGPDCEDAYDVDSNGIITVSDSFYLVCFLSGCGPPPGAPTFCGDLNDSTPGGLSCDDVTCP